MNKLMNQVIKFKEFESDKVDKSVENKMNKRSKENKGIRIIDVKYIANGFGSHALVIYQDGEEDE